MYENLCKKWSVEPKQVHAGIEVMLDTGLLSITNSGTVAAILDLLAAGDIKKEEPVAPWCEACGISLAGSGYYITYQPSPNEEHKVCSPLCLGTIKASLDTVTRTKYK